MRNALWPAAALLLAVFALALSGGSSRPHALAAPTLVVTKEADTNDGVCNSDCSLREALTVVQPQDVIGFAIAGSGVHTIVIDPADALPSILSGHSGVMIDGYSQTGAHANTAGQYQAGNAVIKIVIDGHLLSASPTGLWIGASDVTVQGLSIVNFADEGIKVATFATSATIVGNYLGVLPDGHTAGPNGTGVLVRSSEAGNSIGGADPTKRNLISGNTGAGISVTGGYAVNIAGNFIGTDVTGSQALPNGGNGIDMAGGPNSQVGGDLTSGGNLISGNTLNGIALSTDDGSDMEIRGNYIGVAADGVTPMPNGHDGVYLSQNAANNTIGGEFNAGEKNIIAYNADAGVGFAASSGPDNYVDPNFMYANGGLGVDINDDGLVLPNDLGDATCNGGALPAHCPDADGGTDGIGPTGPNRLMNYPIITNATYVGSTLHFDARLDTFPNHYYNMFFFWNDTCDASGNGEGRYFLGSLGFNPDGADYTFDRTFANVFLAGDVYLTMSASDPESSSEFSPCYVIHTGIPVTASPTPTISPTPTASPTPSPTPTPSPSPTPTPTAAPQPKQGDINCDDSITIQDFFLLMGYLAANQPVPTPAGCPTPGQGVGFGAHVFMDLNCDLSAVQLPAGLAATGVDANDALILLAAIAGVVPSGVPPLCPAVGDRLT